MEASSKTHLILLLLLLCGFTQSQIIDSAPNNGLMCTFCKDIVTLFDKWVETNKTIEKLEEEAVKICVDLHIQYVNENVCYGLVQEFAPEVLAILSTDIDPNTVCNFFYFCHNTSSENVDYYAAPKSAQVSVPIPLSASEGTDDSTVRIIHLSDLHYDTEYAIGSDPDCGDPLCCRSSNGFNGTKAASRWGEPRCDTTQDMLTNLLDELTSGQYPVDALILTGDYTPHDVWEESKEAQLSRLETLSSIFYQYFTNVSNPIPVFPVIGNHDTFPVDQFSLLPKDSGHYDQFTWLTEAVAAYWSPWIPYDAQATLKAQGYYTVLIKPGLRLVVINTQWADSLNFYLILKEQQQMNQFQWMQNVLESSRMNCESVIIAGHIPSGEASLTLVDSYAKKYVDIINQYQDVVIAQLYGHTHNDQFEIVYDGSKQPVGVEYITSSVTPFGHHNPGFRIYEFQKQNVSDACGSRYFLNDYYHFLTNLDEAVKNDLPQWKLEYSAKEAFDLKDLSPRSWDDLVKRFEIDDALFQKWYAIMHTQLNTSDCTSKCKLQSICKLKSAVYNVECNLV